MSDHEPKTIDELAAQTAQQAMSEVFANTVKGRDFFPVGVELDHDASWKSEWVRTDFNRWKLVRS
jgi:hypothetical protein